MSECEYEPEMVIVSNIFVGGMDLKHGGMLD